MATNAQGYPYPVGTDRVMDGDDAIKALADTVGVKAGVRLVSGQAIATATAASSANVAVTFPAGAFSATPRVAATVTTSTTSVYAIATGISATGVTLSIISKTGTAVTVTAQIDYLAHQLT